jgi:hypothetical protein
VLPGPVRERERGGQEAGDDKRGGEDDQTTMTDVPLTER